MRRLRRSLLLLPLLMAPALLLAQPRPETHGAALERATAEARAAEAEVRRLEQAARQATGEAERLRARQAAAAGAIAAAEARISAADARARLIAAEIEKRKAKLAEQQAPIGSLLGGLALMANRPPLLAVLDQGSIEEFVRVRLLVDSTLPVIRARTAALSSEIERGRRLEQAALDARSASLRNRQILDSRRREFAKLEQQALELAERRGSQAFGAGDTLLARREDVSELSRAAERDRAGARFAAVLADLPPPPPRPGPPRGEARASDLSYRLPASAPVVEGLGSVDESGVRARGLTLATRRGAPLAVPASGIVRFAGPFRAYDGIVIIDHGGGWMSLILNASTPLEVGSKVGIGQPLGRALGPLGVELSQNGRWLSPALIAGSSQNLSKAPKDG